MPIDLRSKKYVKINPRISSTTRPGEWKKLERQENARRSIGRKMDFHAAGDDRGVHENRRTRFSEGRKDSGSTPSRRNERDFQQSYNNRENAGGRFRGKMQSDVADCDNKIYDRRNGRDSSIDRRGRGRGDDGCYQYKAADSWGSVIRSRGDSRKDTGGSFRERTTYAPPHSYHRRNQRDFHGDSDDERRVGGEKEFTGYGRKDSGRIGNRGRYREQYKGKAQLKEKIDGAKPVERNKRNNEAEVGESEPEDKDKHEQTPRKKPVRFQTRVIDRTGKKLRGHKKPSDDEAGVVEATPKKRRRIIKIDPYDLSNKRLDDGIPDNEQHTKKEEKHGEKKGELSMNAQFRAILPSDAILSFVEDNLLGRRRSIELQNAGYNLKLPVPLDNIPFSTSAQRERIEENVFTNKLEFFAAARIASSFPPPIIPEVAFAGRSNVGKSSLLNALTRQWGVVRTSDKPGLTQTINFFRLASKLCLVDLPGYGFAYAKDEVKEAWEELVKEYVSTRVGLKQVCVLIDTKWGMKSRDQELIELMERSQTPYQIVLTKTDVIFPIDVARRAMQVQESLKANKSIVKPVMVVSSKSGAGIRSLRTLLAKIARFAKP